VPDEENSPVCPRHERRHRWRLVDFDRAYKTHFTSAVPDNEEYLTTILPQTENVINEYFWGWFDDAFY
jgi:hypothetical protein